MLLFISFILTSNFVLHQV